MIRIAYIRKQVLSIYRQMDKIVYPIRPAECLPPRCRMMSYQNLAASAGCSITDVATLCNSYSGATHYNKSDGKFLILYNDFESKGRTLWTQCHEIGHIVLGHFNCQFDQSIADGELNKQFEEEANYFSWNLLAPLPIMREMEVSSAIQIQETYGLSVQASEIHFERYQNWIHGHIKNAFENDIIREFRKKYSY